MVMMPDARISLYFLKIKMIKSQPIYIIELDGNEVIYNRNCEIGTDITPRSYLMGQNKNRKTGAKGNKEISLDRWVFSSFSVYSFLNTLR